MHYIPKCSNIWQVENSKKLKFIIVYLYLFIFIQRV
jgi:hypothetical protein